MQDDLAAIHVQVAALPPPTSSSDSLAHSGDQGSGSSVASGGAVPPPVVGKPSPQSRQSVSQREMTYLKLGELCHLVLRNVVAVEEPSALSHLKEIKRVLSEEEEEVSQALGQFWDVTPVVHLVTVASSCGLFPVRPVIFREAASLSHSLLRLWHRSIKREHAS